MLLKEIVGELELKLIDDRLDFLDDLRRDLLHDEVMELLRALVSLGIAKQV